MKRYTVVSQKNRYDGKRVYNTTRYPKIVATDDDAIIIAGEADYLDTLAHKFYNDPTLWWIIALANNIGKGRLSVEEGLQLRIPRNVNRIIEEFKNLNSI